MIEYQGDLVEATLSNESIGDPTAPGLLFINYKSPDYTGHVYGMFDPMTGDAPATSTRSSGDSSRSSTASTRAGTR